MKKVIVLLTFLTGAICFISAGLYINKQNNGLGEVIEEQQVNTNVPELLSQIDMTSYVSLPESFEDIDIVENLDDIKVTEENVESVMYDQLMKSATQLDTLEGNEKTITMDYTIVKDGDVKEVKTGFVTGYSDESSIYGEKTYKALKDVSVNTPVHIENATFNGFDDAIVDITITNILDMPYPVTDDYISENTEYDSVYNMKSALINDASGEAKEIARTQTINSLIDIMLEQTTFIQLPESLVSQELEVLQKENKNATYADAKHSLNKIFFIASVIDSYDVTTKTDMEKRYEKLDETEKEGLSEYEKERRKYLLFEEDVITCVYKHVQVTNQK